jgi:large subunit ribosomal protein L11
VAKKLKAVVRLQIEAGKANPAPPIGPALAGHGINLMAFCKEYNARTSNRPGEILPAEISIFTDGSFTFILKTPASLSAPEKGSRDPERLCCPQQRESRQGVSPQVREIAELK